MHPFIDWSHCCALDVKPVLFQFFQTRYLSRLLSPHIIFSRTSRRCLRPLPRNLNYLPLLQTIQLWRAPLSSIAEPYSPCVSSHQYSSHLWLCYSNHSRNHFVGRHVRTISALCTHFRDGRRNCWNLHEEKLFDLASFVFLQTHHCWLRSKSTLILFLGLDWSIAKTNMFLLK